MKKYQNVEFKRRYSIELLDLFFEEFPEERRGRKNLRKKKYKMLSILFMRKYFKKQ